MAKSKKIEELEQRLGELTLDLQRTRADFENYRKRVESEKQAAQELGQTKAIIKLLPMIDAIERATSNMPSELADDAWAKGVSAMAKNLSKITAEFGLERIVIKPGETEFNPDLHNAISMEDSDGDKEVVVEELQTGYLLNGNVIREAMVYVARV